MWVARLSLLAGLACSPPSAARGQEAPQDKQGPTTPQVELARLAHQERLLTALLDPLKGYLSALDEQAGRAAAERDYDTAVHAMEERRRMQTELERIVMELSLVQSRQETVKRALVPDRVELPLDRARLINTRWSEDGKSVTQWSRPGDGLEWTLPDLPPGGYEVVITYECSPLEGGILQCSEARYHLSAGLDTTLRGPETKNLGTLRLTDGGGVLRLTARTVVKDNLMRLHAVALIPASQ
jgi:hypothetical protein